MSQDMNRGKYIVYIFCFHYNSASLSGGFTSSTCTSLTFGSRVDMDSPGVKLCTSATPAWTAQNITQTTLQSFQWIMRDSSIWKLVPQLHCCFYLIINITHYIKVIPSLSSSDWKRMRNPKICLCKTSMSISRNGDYHDGWPWLWNYFHVLLSGEWLEKKKNLTEGKAWLNARATTHSTADMRIFSQAGAALEKPPTQEHSLGRSSQISTM